VGVDGIAVRARQQLGPTATDMEIKLAEGALRADGQTTFGLKASLGPIRMFSGGPSLGKVNLDTQVQAATHVTVDNSGKVEMTVAAAFSVLGIRMTLPKIKLDAPKFDDIPPAILRYVEKNAAALLAELLQLENWLKSILQGVISEVEDAARVLKEHFKQAEAEIARALHRLGRNVEEIVKSLDRLAYTPEQIVKAMGSLAGQVGDTTEEVTRVLIETLGKPADTVAGALKAASKAPQVVKDALEKAGVPIGEVEKVITKHFPDVTVSGPFLKIKEPFGKLGDPFFKAGFNKLHIKRLF
jgi:hypothetical protein